MNVHEELATLALSIKALSEAVSELSSMMHDHLKREHQLDLRLIEVERKLVLTEPDNK